MLLFIILFVYDKIFFLIIIALLLYSFNIKNCISAIYYQIVVILRYYCVLLLVFLLKLYLCRV